MVGSFVRLAAAAVFSASLAGCASSPDFDDADYTPSHSAPRGERHEADSPLQCVPYAREQSGIMIYGDAYTWWAKAEGRFARSTMPSQGAVMVLYNYAGPNRAHVAVVKKITGEREMRIDHANWLDDGAIYTGNPVRDVSPNNDWSQVRVYNIRAGAWGSRVYDVQGFIGPGPGSNDLMLAQNGHSTPTAGSGRSGGDPIAALIAGEGDLADGDMN